MSMSDYSQLEGEIKNAPERKPLPAKTEAKLRIVSVNSGVVEDESKASYGAEWHQVTFDIPNEFVPMFNDFFFDLNSKDKITENQYKDALGKFRAFAEAFNIDYSRPFNWDDDLPGLEGWAILGFKEDDEFGDKNTVRRYIVPK